MNTYQRLLADLALQGPEVEPLTSPAPDYLVGELLNYDFPTHSPTNFDMKGALLTPQLVDGMRSQMSEPLPTPLVISKEQWQAMLPEAKEGRTAVESPWLPQGTVCVRASESDNELKFEPVVWRGSSMDDLQSSYSERICGAFGLPSSLLDSSLVALGESLYRASFPVISRPQAICHFTSMEPQLSIPRFNAQEIRQIKKFLYWATRAKGLRRDGYFERLALEGKGVCYHGARGEDRRYARWRLAFHESTALCQQIELLLQ